MNKLEELKKLNWYIPPVSDPRTYRADTPSGNYFLSRTRCYKVEMDAAGKAVQIPEVKLTYSQNNELYEYVKNKLGA